MIDVSTLDAEFFSVPGGDLVDKLIMQMQKVPQMVKLFGPGGVDGSWANYNRFDWPVRQLPAMNVLEAGAESKTSDSGYLNGTIQIQVYWPSEFRRSDLARVPGFFKGILENFFSSKYVGSMLDELYFIQRPEKVYGLNELGKTLTWSPNVDGINDGDLVPMTIVDVQYRIDLRSWERALEFENRTKDDPFTNSLGDLTEIFGELDGIDDDKNIDVRVPINLTVNEG